MVNCRICGKNLGSGYDITEGTVQIGEHGKESRRWKGGLVSYCKECWKNKERSL